MKTISAFFPSIAAIAVFTSVASACGIYVEDESEIENPFIDTRSYADTVNESLQLRELRRLTENEFIEAIKSGEYILLDARSKANYDLRHIFGAVNLPFTEFTADNLARIVPSKDTKILIYCNNNFFAGTESLITKSIAASLNLSTQAALNAYGYKQVYELGPLLDMRTTKISFAGTEVVQELVSQWDFFMLDR
ncbi:MAG: rhodanese-like domain-containing protein [Verrucomicrobiota bacterium]